jgi:hypothetical protein
MEQIREQPEQAYSCRWDVLQRQLDNITALVASHGASPGDLTTSQLMHVGSHLVLIDYEQYTTFDRQDPYATAKLDGAFLFLEFGLRLQWARTRIWSGEMDISKALGTNLASRLDFMIKNTKQYGEIEHPLAARLSQELGIVDTRTAELHQDALLWYLYRDPLQYEQYRDRHEHAVLKKILADWLARSDPVTIGLVTPPRRQTQQERFGPQCARKAVQEALDSVSRAAYGITSAPHDGAPKNKAGAVQFTSPMLHTATASLADIVVLQIEVLETEEASVHAGLDGGWLDDVMEMLAIQIAGVPTPPVVVLFEWNGATAWSDSTWSRWHRSQLEAALRHQKKGELDISIIGTGFPHALGKAGADVCPAACVESMAKTIEFFVTKEMLSPITIPDGAPALNTPEQAWRTCFEVLLANRRGQESGVYYVQPSTDEDPHKANCDGTLLERLQAEALGRPYHRKK